MKTIVKSLALSAAASSVLMAGAYKIPEQSLNSMALGGAYIAHTTHADTAYFNPANMAFMGENQYVEGAITLAHLPSTDYYGQFETETENILIPNFHYVAAPMDDFRWGVSMTAPGGLTKRWENSPASAFAEEFTLTNVELSGAVSYKVMENFSIGGGLRLIYSEGVVKNDAAALGSPFKVDMEGDTIEFGYNLAATYKPTEDVSIAATYRSNVDLEEEGTATITYPTPGRPLTVTGDAGVSVPLPAALNIAISKTWNNSFTLEAVYERTYWSAYETLEFTGTNLPISAKNWEDTNTFRLGATVQLEKITMMMAFAIDETPVPDGTISFELPDSDAKIFSMGFRYQQTEELSWGAAFLYDSKEPRSIAKGIADNPIIHANGASFNGGGALLTTVGMAYEF